MAGTANMRADDTYTQVMSLDDIDTEATYILADFPNSSSVRAMGAMNDNNYGTIVSTGLSRIGNTTIKVNSNADPLKLTIGKIGEKYTLSFGTTPLYYTNNNSFSYTNGNNWTIIYNDTYSRLIFCNSKLSYCISRNGDKYIGTYVVSNLDSNGKTTLFKKNVTNSAVYPPEFSLPPKAYQYGTTFTISSNNAKKIIYTTDGSVPSLINGTEYSTAIPITSTMKVKAIAYDNNDIPTAVVTYNYDVSYTGEGNVSVASACTDGTKYYSTYSNSHAFVVPNGLTVSEIAVANGKLTISDYEEGDIVPANTGVMVSSETAGEKTINFTGVTGTSVLGVSNCLRPSGDAGITAAAMASADGSCKFYRLTMHNGEQIGYWWGADEGGAFSVAANKAYLAVPQSQEARAGFSLFDEETAIKQLLSDSQAENGTQDCYDLQGRKIVNNKLQKGLYIIKGRKVIR